MRSPRVELGHKAPDRTVNLPIQEYWLPNLNRKGMDCFEIIGHDRVTTRNLTRWCFFANGSLNQATRWDDTEICTTLQQADLLMRKHSPTMPGNNHWNFFPALGTSRGLPNFSPPVFHKKNAFKNVSFFYQTWLSYSSNFLNDETFLPVFSVKLVWQYKKSLCEAPFCHKINKNYKNHCLLWCTSHKCGTN